MRRLLPLALAAALGAPSAAQAGAALDGLRATREWKAPKAAPAQKGGSGDALKDALRGRSAWKKGTWLRKLRLVSEERLEEKRAAATKGSVLAIAAKKRGERVLQTNQDLALHLEVLDQQLHGFLPPETHAEVGKIVNQALGKVADKTLYMRRGLHGVADLLADEMLHGELARTPEEIARLVIAAQAVRAVATSNSLHAVGGAGQDALEVQYALRKDAGLQKLLDEARAEGVEIHFRRGERVPEHALQAINRIAVLTQENFLQNWLPQMVKGGRRPVLRFGKNGLTRAREAGLVDKDASEADILAQLERDVQTIFDARGSMMGFVVRGGGPQHAALQQRLDAALDDLRTDHALNRMLFDNADERTGEAQEIVKKMMWVGPIAHGLEMFNLGAMAKLFAGSADDLLGLFAEYKALRGSGFGRKEIMKRWWYVPGVFGGAAFASFKVEHLLKTGHEGAAGALFGVSAVALSLATSIQSMALYKNAYDSLVAEGKIEGKSQLAGDPRFQATLKLLDRSKALVGPGGKEKLLAEVKRHLDGLEGLVSAEDKAMMLDELGKLDLAAMYKQLKKPSLMTRWKEAVRQDFSNPTRLGLLLGSATAPIAGFLTAKAGLMHNGFVMAAVGSTESLVSGLTVAMARRLNDAKQRRLLQAKLDAM